MYSNFQITEPDISAAMGLFTHLNIDELKELLNDDRKCEVMIKDVKQNKAQESERELLLASNRSLADFNLSYEPKLETGKKKLRELTERAQELCLSVQNKATELSQKSGNMSLDTALALLQTAAAESEEESETLAERYLNSDLDLDNFLDQFLAKRKEMHLRRVKVEKMSEMIMSPTRAAPPIPARAPYPINSPPYPSSNHVPYQPPY